MRWVASQGFFIYEPRFSLIAPDLHRLPLHWGFFIYDLLRTLSLFANYLGVSRMKISPNFSRAEFACACGCGLDTADHQLVEMLEIVRGRYDLPVIITSGCRCVSHNEKIQKEANPNYVPYSSHSQHLYGRAVDFQVKGVEPDRVYDFIHRHAPDRFGLGLYKTWVHLDTRTNGPARWGK